MSTRPAVIVVEDNDDIARMLDLALAGRGFDVHRIPIGQVLDEDAYLQGAQAAIIDLNLGAVSGGDVCGMLRRVRPGMRLVVLSAYEGPDLTLPPWDAFLLKPAPIDRIVAEVQAR